MRPRRIAVALAMTLTLLSKIGTRAISASGWVASRSGCGQRVGGVGGFVAPAIPAGARLAAAIQFDLRNVGEIRFDQLIGFFRLSRMLALPLTDHARPLRARCWCGDVAAGT